MSDSQLDPLGPEKIAIERIRLRTERQRLVVETLLKRRELGERGKKSWREVFANPLMLAVVGGLLTVITTLVTSSFTAHQNREAEDRRAENTQRSAKQALQAELIKKFVEAPKTETVRENLRFLVDSGLLPDYADGIKGYLKDNPNSAPTIAPLVGAVVGAQDQRQLLSALPSQSQGKFLGIGIVRSGQQSVCTGFMISPKILATAQHCVQTFNPASQSIRPLITFQLAPIGPGAVSSRPVEIDMTKMLVLKKDESGHSSVALAPLRGDAALPYLLLADAAAPVATQLDSVFFAADRSDWVYSSGAGCRVLAVESKMLRHLCDTGSGSSGAPLLAPSGRVLAIHVGLGTESKTAVRADLIRTDPDVTRHFGDLPVAPANPSQP